MAAAAPQPVTDAPQPSGAFKFHSRTFLAFVLKPEMPIGRWMAQADTWLARSPDFFAAKPVVVDVTSLLLTKSNLSQLIADLGARRMRVMGLLGADPAWVDADLPPVLMPGRATDPKTAPKTHEAAAPVRTAPSSLVIDTHVRSGQTLFHDGDLTIVGSVSSGAEIVATGSIHIYGALRGRVLAGADGNIAAHIFCRRLAAELVAIDGYYRMAEDFSSTLIEKPAHVALEEGVLKIKALD